MTPVSKVPEDVLLALKNQAKKKNVAIGPSFERAMSDYLGLLKNEKTLKDYPQFRKSPQLMKS